MKETEKSPLEKFQEQEEADARRKARGHSTPRLDAFRARLADIPTSKLIEHISDYVARAAVQHAVDRDVLADVLLCGEVLVPYKDGTRGWTTHVPNRPPPEAYFGDHQTLYAGYVAACDEIDRRYTPGKKD